ncbi:hypothetical protein CH251_07910 [Rhodococcus sp. 06-462-5]|uniref:hypothetical protein n=1 Tax=unclassified Rhodococcus (in: high G+C Gram-positive bacteria) TaxID=192944 RepID=UPI000B9BD0AC|nr:MULTISPECIES: hypothetical protein [unclassified Rhodococcus (in: high G+C Gram-positive bacteria)]OZC75895.1 hypothetical protein CH251_07910 [Rhodococcus sp. 06-462-5]OZE70110.1 hypothetical protein CH270_02085 [Rhodococcus sp. 02-925g]
MTYTSTPVSRRPAPALRTAEVAGIAWPVYKLEALALGFIVFAATLLVAGSLHPAVLAGAAVAVVAWWTLRLTELGSTGPASARQAARAE